MDDTTLAMISQLRDDLARVTGLSPALLARPADINRAQGEQLSEMMAQLKRRIQRKRRGIIHYDR